ncbi:MFS transporter [Candidatus Bathyarchaeota archaeon]|nr:MFS transporter [Candidatus Bathyarchaeota archaeon]MBL7079667.1 MFS transporter [Candidatus Bathyarchaeota archaeon]
MKKEDVSVIAIAGSHGIMHAYLVLLPALIPLLKGELGNYGTLGLLASLVFLFYGWGSFPVGFLADRISKKLLISASMALCGVSAILVSLSHSLPITALALILLGIGASLYHPPGYASMALLSKEMRGRYMGIQGLGGDLGMAISFFTTTAIGSYLGWRNAFLAWGALGIVMAVVDMGTIIDETIQVYPSVARLGYLETLRKMFTTDHLRNLLLVSVIVVCSGALWNGVSAFILVYINEVKGVSLLIAGGLSTFKYTIGAFGNILGGELSDKLGRRKILLFGFGLFTVSLLALTIAPGNLALMFLMVAVLGFSFFITQSPMNALIGDVSHRDTVGVTYGVNFSIKYGIGSFAPAIAGFLAAQYSMDYVFYFFAVISAVAFGVSLMVKDIDK